MKLLFLTDIHVTGTPPKGCKQIYTDDIFNMLEECKQIAIKNEVDLTLFGGDMFHYKRNESFSTVNRLIDVLSGWPGRVRAIVGNHDLSYAGINSIDEQPIGTMFRSRLVWLKEEDILDFYTPDEGTVVVRIDPANYVDDIDEHPERLGCEPFEWNGCDCCHKYVDWTIKVAHASIVLPGKEYPYACIPMDQIPTDNIDLFLFGHLHHYTGIHTVNGCTFAGLGSLGRTQRDDYNYMRRPRVLMVEFTKDEMKLEEIELTSAVPPEELFYSKEAAETTTEDSMAKFFRHMDRVVSLEAVNVDDALLDVLDETTEPPVILRVKKHLGEAGW